MSPSTIVPRTRHAASPRVGASPAHAEPEPKPRTLILTHAEVAECTCPDACERDHERD